MLRYLFAALVVTGPAMADPVNIRPDVPTVTVDTPSGPREIGRNQDNDAVLTDEWAKTSRACPPFCIQPMEPAEGVATVGELELLDALSSGDAVLIDSRTPEWFRGGTIPGAINIPYTRIIDELGSLGCEIDFDGWICDDAKEVILFCNGPWCGQSPTAIGNMLEAGYPAERIRYYRGGMQVWRMLGLTVTGGEG